MTTNHAAKIWGFGGSATLSGQQPASRIKRLFPIVRDGMAATSIRHYVAGPWPLASDAFGVAYPAGLLLVAGDVGFFGSGSFDTQCEQYWQNAVTSGGTANVFAVPQVLPGGYTRTGQPTFFGLASQVFPGPPWFRFTASGIATNTGWTPRIASNGDTFTTGLFASDPASGNNGTFRLNSFLTPITADVGYRKCQLTVGIVLSSFGSAGIAGGSLSYTISHNADGSIGSSSGDLDTIDYSGTITAAQINAHGTNLFPGWNWQTDPIDIGSLTSPIGTPCRFAIRVTAFDMTYIPSGGSTPIAAPKNYGASCQASLRCDIPFQCDIPGAGDLVAPGGYVP